jgi:hypothetical protein
MKTVEFIESYRVPEDGGDYLWNDNHGRLIRCKDCKYRDADDFCTGRGYPNVLVPDDGFCDKGSGKE